MSAYREPNPPGMAVLLYLVGALAIIGGAISLIVLWPPYVYPYRRTFADFMPGLTLAVTGAVAGVAFFGFARIVSLLHDIRDQLRSPAQGSSSTTLDKFLADTRPCPHCAEAIQKAAKVCRFCNRDVAPDAPPLRYDLATGQIR